MTDLQEKAMRMALETLEHIHRCIGSGSATIHWDSATWHQSDATIEALRQALAQPDEVLAAREACASLCSAVAAGRDAEAIEEAIRARGEK